MDKLDESMVRFFENTAVYWEKDARYYKLTFNRKRRKYAEAKAHYNRRMAAWYRAKPTDPTGDDMCYDTNCGSNKVHPHAL